MSQSDNIKFQQLRQRHITLLDREDELVSKDKKEKLVVEAESLLDEIIETGRDIVDEGRRQILSSYAEHWGLFIYLNTNLYPNTSLFKAEGRKLETNLLEIQEKPEKETKSLSFKNWTFLPTISDFQGRNKELNILEKWITEEGCRLISILGIGGIGKTALAVKLAQNQIIQNNFEYFIWVSLRTAPSVEEIIFELINSISLGKASNLPNDLLEKISLLISCLKEHRCLILLDNFETIFQSPEQIGYQELLQQVGEVAHKSCMVLTSRRKPVEISLEKSISSIRSLNLGGLPEDIGIKILEAKGLTIDENLKKVAKKCSGNPLILKIAATEIKNKFSGNVPEFLEKSQFNSVTDLLNSQFKDLSKNEKDIMYWLAISQDSITQEILEEDIITNQLKDELTDVIKSLRGRFLIEERILNLQPVIMEDVIKRLIQEIVEEIKTIRFTIFKSHALMKATAKDKYRKSQIKNIIEPIIKNLRDDFGSDENFRSRLLEILKREQQGYLGENDGYLGGNILNLLCCLEVPLNGNDFSKLTLWQVYFKGTDLSNVNFANSDLSKCVFNDSIGSISSLAFSPKDSNILATGDFHNNVCIWKVNQGRKEQILLEENNNKSSHDGLVRTLTFSPSGDALISGGEDKLIKIWNMKTKDDSNAKVFQGHTKPVWSVAFHPSGSYIASGSDDKTLKLWNVLTRQCIDTVQAHKETIWSVAFHPNGNYIVTASRDKVVKLWKIKKTNNSENLSIESKPYKQREFDDWVRVVKFSPDGKYLAIINDKLIKLLDPETFETLSPLDGLPNLDEHPQKIWSIVFSHSSNILASAGDAQSIQICQLDTHECRLIPLPEGTSRIRTIEFSPDDKMLAIGSEYQTLQVIDVSDQDLRTLQSKAGGVWSVAFNPTNNKILASGGSDLKVKIWDAEKEQPLLRNLEKHSKWIRCLAFSPDGTILASASDDKTVILWNLKTYAPPHILRGHNGWIWSVSFSPDGKILASGSDDKTVKLWNVETGEPITILEGHKDWVWSVSFSPNGKYIASCGADGIINIWNNKTYTIFKTWKYSNPRIRAITFSPDSNKLASCGDDKKVILWNIEKWDTEIDAPESKLLQEHENRIRSLAFSPDGKKLASGSEDKNIKIWDFDTDKPMELEGDRHTQWVLSVAFSSDNKTLASGSEDETIKLWDVKTGRLMKTLKYKSPYQEMNITGVKGLTEAQKITLKALGANDYNE